MHPAPSIIAFTTLSGLGFGMMVWLGFFQPDFPPFVAATFCLLALALSGAGLLSSLFHLGNPQRLLKAFSQWRSSWLSREGIAAILSMALFSLHGMTWVLTGNPNMLLGICSAILALITILCTAMIYAQMKSVPRWHSPLTPLLFVAYALTGGALLAGKISIAIWLMPLLGLIQITAWIKGDAAFAATGSTTGTATGLGHLGQVRLLESPHSGENYLTREMVFRIGRKHAQKLRLIGFFLAVVVPLVLSLAFSVGHMLGGLILISHILGTITTRWLFFAEARHVVSLYYDKSQR